MTLFQKFTNWLFGTPPIPSSTVDKAPPAPLPAASDFDKRMWDKSVNPPTTDPNAPAIVTVSVQPLPEPPKEITLTLNHPSEWPFTDTVAVTQETPQHKPRQKKAAGPAAMTPSEKPRKPRQKKK